jgi:outer membrane protein TolC
MPPGGERVDFQEPPAMERTLSKASRQGAATAVNAWPEDEWWRQFRSPELDRVMDIALRDNPGLKKAYDRLNEAGAVANVEGARLVLCPVFLSRIPSTLPFGRFLAFRGRALS